MKIEGGSDAAKRFDFVMALTSLGAFRSSGGAVFVKLLRLGDGAFTFVKVGTAPQA